MSDEQAPHSGSRWEPPQTPAPPPAEPPPTPSPGDASDPAEVRPRRRTWRDRAGRREVGLGLGALALVLVGGLGGAAVAGAAAGDDHGPDGGWVRDAGFPDGRQPGPGLQEPLGPDTGGLPAWGHDDDADDVGGVDDGDHAEEHGRTGDHDEQEGPEAEHSGADT